MIPTVSPFLQAETLNITQKWSGRQITMKSYAYNVTIKISYKVTLKFP